MDGRLRAIMESLDVPQVFWTAESGGQKLDSSHGKFQLVSADQENQPVQSGTDDSFENSHVTVAEAPRLVPR